MWLESFILTEYVNNFVSIWQRWTALNRRIWKLFLLPAFLMERDHRMLSAVSKCLREWYCIWIIPLLYGSIEHPTQETSLGSTFSLCFHIAGALTVSFHCNLRTTYLFIYLFYILLYINNQEQPDYLFLFKCHSEHYSLVLDFMELQGNLLFLKLNSISAGQNLHFPIDFSLADKLCKHTKTYT